MAKKQNPKPRRDEIVYPLPHYVVEETEVVVEGALYRFKIKPGSKNGNHKQQDQTQQTPQPQSGD